MTWFDSFPKANVSGFTMLVDPDDDNIRRHLQDRGVWEPKGMDLVAREFTGGVFVDAGAHWGSYSLAASRKAEIVYAFEANPFNFRYLFLNILINKLDNVYPFPIGLEDKPMEATAYFHQDNTGGSYIGPRDPKEPLIHATSFDSLGLGKVDFIKVDCEGQDAQVLEGAKETLGRWHPKVLVEHPPEEFLKSLGYTQTEDISSEMGPLRFWKA